MTPPQTTRAPRENFGGNIRLRPATHYTPANESELLAILRAHRDQQIRAVGRLHSWSPLVDSHDLLVDLCKFDSVVVQADGDQPWADVGAGCQIKRLLSELLRQGSYTTLTQGLIKEQALAGAAATGTHGSGKHSLSHYIQSLRVARFDPTTREPRIDTIDTGAQLAAARCALGCLGIVTSIRIPIRRVYQVEEHFRQYGTLGEVLAAEREYPLQQFFLVPWRWDYFAQHRRETAAPRSRLAPLYRLFWALAMDIGFHWLVFALARWLPDWCTKLYYRRIMPALTPRGWKVVDRSDRQLSMAHELFRHIETEIFVTSSQLPAALDLVALLLRHAAGERVELGDDLHRALTEAQLLPQWTAAGGCYVHHYPICIRKVLPDAALISMSAGDEPQYAISVISYASPHRRGGFFQCAELLTRSLARLFQGRPHWGKHCPADPADLDALYPELDAFRTIARRSDPRGQFTNAWLQQMLFAGPATRPNSERPL